MQLTRIWPLIQALSSIYSIFHHYAHWMYEYIFLICETTNEDVDSTKINEGGGMMFMFHFQ